MKREFTYTTNINGNEVQLTSTLTITKEEIDQIFSQKQQQFIASMNLTQNNCNEDCSETCADGPDLDSEEINSQANLYQTYTSSDSPSYTAYSSNTPTASEEPLKEKYTPYASMQSSQIFPKSYHVELENGYAPYTSWRVNVPSDKKITIE